jgi:hypothetical protein
LDINRFTLGWLQQEWEHQEWEHWKGEAAHEKEA